MLTFDFIYTSVLLVLMTTALIREWLETDLAVFSVLILLTIGKVITVNEAFSGFSNQGMLTVAFLFIVAGALQKTGILNRLGEVVLGKKGPTSRKLLRLLFPVAGISAFFNNTPLVAMLMPAIRSWTRKHDASVSKFLIPLSYAAILGGMCTLIGTSTNLVVHGLIIQHGMPGFGFFELSKVGIPVAVIGILTVALLGHRFLPERKEPMVQLGEQTREFVVVMKVDARYQHAGRTIEEAGLRHLKGLFLFQIERQKEIIASVSHDERIQENDRLFFTGLPETILELQKTQGLSILKDETLDLKTYDSDTIGTFEAVVSLNSPLTGKNVRDSNFRGKYNAVIVAIHRSGARIRKKIGDVVLQPGDTLLLLAQKNFFEEYYHSKDFYLVSRSVEVPSKPKKISIFSLVILVLMILAMAFNLAPIVLITAIAAVVLIVSGSISAYDARQSVEWKVLLVIASAFGIAKAMENSGLAQFLAGGLVNGLSPLGILGLVAGTYYITSFYTEIITNNAAAALVFPIALAVSRQAGLDPRPFLVAVTIGASASFATPIGYATNLMVYGPGGYKFKDFLKIGIPMNLFVGVLTISMIYFWYFA